MDLTNNIVLLVGKSGTGKTTIAQELCDMYGLKMLDSYTTRPKRTPNEKGHTFVTDEEFSEIINDTVGLTRFNGYLYGATNKQIDESDVYVIDPAGIEYFMNEYEGEKKPIIINLQASKKTRKNRMRSRGDGLIKAWKRLRWDEKNFGEEKMSHYNVATVNAEGDINDVLNAVSTTILFYIRFYEIEQEANGGGK